MLYMNNFQNSILVNELNNRENKFCISLTQLMIHDHQLTVTQTILETMSTIFLHIKEEVPSSTTIHCYLEQNSCMLKTNWRWRRPAYFWSLLSSCNLPHMIACLS
jgi:hypothetical protein